MFAEYKGTRKPMAAELKQQVPLMKEMLRAMGVTIVEKGGYEADDLLGTIAKRSEAAGVEVAVVPVTVIFCSLQQIISRSGSRRRRGREPRLRTTTRRKSSRSTR